MIEKKRIGFLGAIPPACFLGFLTKLKELFCCSGLINFVLSMCTNPVLTVSFVHTAQKSVQGSLMDSTSLSKMVRRVVGESAQIIKHFLIVVAIVEL